MRVVRTEFLIRNGVFATSTEANHILDEIARGVAEVKWPIGSDNFTIYPVDKANGVKPIKTSFLAHLGSQERRWHVELPGTERPPGRLDGVKTLSDGRLFAVEWETGNISSSHRAINKMALGMLRNELAGGVLVLPTRAMYRYLTDRVGNYEEIAPYFEIWQNWPHVEGLLAVIAIEHDATSLNAPAIAKGTDGWANHAR